MSRKPIIEYVTKRTKPLGQVKGGDVPRGLTAEDIAAPYEGDSLENLVEDMLVGTDHEETVSPALHARWKSRAKMLGVKGIK